MEPYVNTLKKSLEERQQSLSLCQFAVTDTKNHSLVYSTVTTKKPVGPAGEDGRELTLGFRPRESGSECVDEQLTFHVLFNSDSLEEVLVYHFYGLNYEQFTDLIISYFEKYDFPTDDGKVIELLKDLADSQKEKSYDSIHRRFSPIVRYEQVEPLSRDGIGTQKFTTDKDRKVISIEISLKEYYTEIDLVRWHKHSHRFWEWFKKGKGFEENDTRLEREKEHFDSITGNPAVLLGLVYSYSNHDEVAEIIRDSSVVRTADNAQEKHYKLIMQVSIRIGPLDKHRSILFALREMYDYLETIDTSETPLEEFIKHIEGIVNEFMQHAKMYVMFGEEIRLN